MPLTDIANVDIDPKGTFKYVLIQVKDPSTKTEKFVVRGYYRCSFHDDIFQETKSTAPSNLELTCVGGGRIKHDASGKDILVYGYSYGYGKADHQVSVDILKEKYPDYHVHFSNEGY